jgi:hypothetical protein
MHNTPPDDPTRRLARNITITWFKNPHEQRNDLLRFGLMRRHRAGAVHYAERPLADCTAAGFPTEVADHLHRHTSVILVSQGSQKVRCIVDSEDSFYCLSPLIRHADLYFCAGYNSEFFEHQRFPAPYTWQRENEFAAYRARAQELIDRCADHFPRVRRFVPIGPNFGRRSRIPWHQQKIRNVHHRLSSSLGVGLAWLTDLADFEVRYAELRSYRTLPLAYDVVLVDTLWGWPRHRYGLHQKLHALSKRYEIRSRLGWSEPSDMDGGNVCGLRPSDFPLEIGRIDDYETMLAMSRLAVFATGYHWGWRNIMMFALCTGLPILADRIILEPWFSMERFAIFWNDSSEWDGLETLLDRIGQSDWQRIRAHNQRAYDEVMAPERVATYFVETALSYQLPVERTHVKTGFAVTHDYPFSSEPSQ